MQRFLAGTVAVPRQQPLHQHHRVIAASPLLATVVHHVPHSAEMGAGRVEAAEEVVVLAQRGDAQPAGPCHGWLLWLVLSHVLEPIVSALKVAENLNRSVLDAARAEDIEAENIAMAVGEVPRLALAPQTGQ